MTDDHNPPRPPKPQRRVQGGYSPEARTRPPKPPPSAPPGPRSEKPAEREQGT